MADSLEGLQEPLRSIVAQILKEGGGAVTLTSGARTRAEQASLYQRYLNGTGNLAAKPGTSRHEHGLAVDLSGDPDVRARLAAKYGLAATVPGEPWHFELGGDVAPQGQITLGGGQPIAYDLGYEEPAPRSPEEELAYRLDGIMKIVGGANDLTSLGPVDSSVLSTGELGSPGADGIEGAVQSAGQRAIDDILAGAYPTTSTLIPGQQIADGGLPSGGAPAPAGDLQAFARQQLGDDSQFGALVELWNRESGWNPNAQNPTSTAFGIAQFLDGTWAGTGIQKTSDGRQQIKAGLTYIKARYGSPSAALAFHNRNNFY